MAKINGMICGYNCSNCRNWACTNGGPYKQKGFFPVINWKFICKFGKKQ